MRWSIKKNGIQINTIESGEDFVKRYCGKNGYTYDEIEMPEPEPIPEPEPEPTIWDELAKAYQEGVETA